MAFEQHVVTASAALGREVHPDWYELPVSYFTNPAAVLGHTDDVPVSPGSAAFDFELEAAAVVGTPGHDLDAATAEAHIPGSTLFCDWSARDVQAREMTLGLGPAEGRTARPAWAPTWSRPTRCRPAADGGRRPCR
jgi:2-keto-4-pentenoate hydratase/2-oxohepta-3-ene-1,7-dioic acid hydratase in catechol pathway